ncbi:MAG: hypothetical protein V4489_08715 [Chlamydiota bacterium]
MKLQAYPESSTNIFLDAGANALFSAAVLAANSRVFKFGSPKAAAIFGLVQASITSIGSYYCSKECITSLSDPSFNDFLTPKDIKAIGLDIQTFKKPLKGYQLFPSKPAHIIKVPIETSEKSASKKEQETWEKKLLEGAVAGLFGKIFFSLPGIIFGVGVARLFTPLASSRIHILDAVALNTLFYAESHFIGEELKKAFPSTSCFLHFPEK